ncbi:MAG: alpha-rhamnosidase, partial [Chthoniobacterales bacterium]|nr:alpha-rhamnosidase [Chthoniobacterales bacterium]
MIKHGATTIWELWNGNTADPLMNSGNHVMLLGDFLPWIFCDVAGIREGLPGFERIVLRPHFVFDSVECSHRSPRGRIASSWTKNGDGTIRWTVEIPPGTPACAELPASAVVVSQETGATVAGAETFQSPEGDLVRITLPPGSSAFEIRTKARNPNP